MFSFDRVRKLDYFGFGAELYVRYIPVNTQDPAEKRAAGVTLSLSLGGSQYDLSFVW